MFKYLLFDDQRLLLRTNLKREYGKSEIVGIYKDPQLTTTYGWVWVCRGLDGKINLIHMGAEANGKHLLTGIAESVDGINFTPKNTVGKSGLEHQTIPNQILPPYVGGTEVASIIQDNKAPADERYKMLMCDFKLWGEECRVTNLIYASPDLIRWHEISDSCWNKIGAEPVTGTFYNPVYDVFTILTRPDCGERRVCVTETKDWHHFTDLELCLQSDCQDPALAEIYGMNAMEYDGMFIGMPLIFCNIPQIRMMKFRGGSMHGELAYSFNGRHWQRSLHEPFIGGEHPDLIKKFGKKQNMVFPCAFLRQDDGSILVYASVTEADHGAVLENQRGLDHIAIFRLRQDGFIRLTSENKNDDSTVAFREVCWHGGDLKINIEAESATCAVYEMMMRATDTELRLSHEDCIPFSGNSTEWIPQWKNGASLDQFKGKTIVFEIKFKNGSIYSCYGNGTALMDGEAERYRRTGIIDKNFKTFY